MAVALTTAPSGARFPAGKQTVKVKSARVGAGRRENYVAGIDPIKRLELGAQVGAAVRLLPPIERQ